MAKEEDGWLRKRVGWLRKGDGWLSKGNRWLVGSAPACHGKPSGFETRHPSEIIMGDICKWPAQIYPAKKYAQKGFLDEF